ncbi:MAG: ABC transporter permease [Ruminococcus sp.]|uniref:ABC transporter permease n=1 Tax=Ruminococcus sp. TaxID=41978 RepID=UPI002873EAD8|nr:ABC transporter permease [Ruminococcus sp.]MBQ3285211.1 ABC transporter permease [Ruminococcus sp.]
MEQSKYYKKISAEEKGLRLNLREVMKYRDLIFLLVKRTFVSQYKQTILGPAWAVIQPLLTTVVFTFVFGNVAGLADCGAVPTFLFYMCGNITWGYFAGCLTNTSNTFIANSGTMGKVYFPRLCMPISTVLSQLISFGIQFVMFIVFLVIYLFIPGYSIKINLWALAYPLLVVEMAALGFGVGIIISSLTTKYRDLQFLVGFGVSLWMYGTPVAYSLKLFGTGPLYWIARFNPMTPVIELARYGFLGPEAGSIDPPAIIVSLIVTIILTLIGIFKFNKVERTFMDTV